MCAIDMVTQFLILASVTTRAIEESREEVRAILSRDRQCALKLLSLLFFTVWNKKQSSKRSMILHPKLNSLLKELNDRVISLYLFLMSTMWSLIFCHCLGLRYISKKGWGGVVKDGELSNNDLIIWFVEREWALS